MLFVFQDYLDVHFQAKQMARQLYRTKWAAVCCVYGKIKKQDVATKKCSVVLP